MGDPNSVFPAFSLLVPNRCDALHERRYAFSAAAGMLRKVSGPARKFSLVNSIPALAFPATKIHLGEPGVQSARQIWP